MVERAPHRVRWLVLDLVSVSNVDYTAGLVLQANLHWLVRRGIAVAVAQGNDVVPELLRRGILTPSDGVRTYPTIQAAVSTLLQPSAPAPEA
jgi:MFS superfamily sulfate permease-like transporter